ncbi:MAG: PEP-CTERM sorting domain-containing protein [Acetobacteraceae bacterium]
MTIVKSIAGTAALAAAVLLGCGLAALPAQADYVVTLTQVGSNVVATGSGTIDLTGLSPDGGGSSEAGVEPSAAGINTGPPIFAASSFYTGYTGPASFGSGGQTSASSGSGDIVGIGAFGVDLVVPSGYVSDSALSDTSTYDGATFASLGVTPGTYTWTWGSGPADGNFTLDVKTTAVPEPGSLALLGIGLLGLGLVGFASRRRMAG